MKKILLCLMLMGFSFAFMSGCKKEEEPEVILQITLKEILSVLEDNQNIELDERVYVYMGSAISDVDSREAELITWRANFERQNVDSREFMSVEKIRYSYNSTYHYARLFKFATDTSAAQCANNYDVGEAYSIKQYGNIVVIVDSSVANVVLELIDSI